MPSSQMIAASAVSIILLSCQLISTADAFALDRRRLVLSGTATNGDDAVQINGANGDTADLSDDEKAAASEDPSSCKSVEKPTALLASISRIESLISFLNKNSDAYIGRSFVAPGELYQLLKWDPRTQGLDIEALSDVRFGGDIVLAEQILTGQVSKVIYFHDSSATTSTPGADLSLILRACDLAHVPIALNEASAKMGLMAQKATRRAYLIFNPVAGQRDSSIDLEIIRETLEPSLVLTVIETERDFDPADQAKKLVKIIQKEGKSEVDGMYSMIIASGGDGTVSAIAGATMGSGIPFGIIPRGTANAFSVALGIPTEARAACRNILKGNVRRVDGAMANDVPMLLLAGIGFEAGMVENAPREVKDVLGPVAYVLGGVKQFFTQEVFKCKFDIDGVKSELDSVAAITVATAAPPTSMMAQGAGEVIPDDGLLDITIGAGTRISGLVGMADLATAAVIHRPTDNENLLCMRAKSVTVSCDPPQKVVVDGEMLEMEPIHFEVLPGALHVLAPPA